METIYVRNSKICAGGILKVLKVDAYNRSVALSGAQFTLYLLDEGAHSYIRLYKVLDTGADGSFTVSGLGPGKYRLDETHAPQDYFLPAHNAVYFELSQETEMAVYITITNYRKPKPNCCDCRCHNKTEGL